MAYVHRRAIYYLVVDGVSINAVVNPRLKSLSLTEKRGADADELQLVLDDADGQIQIPNAGAVISLKLGWVDLAAGTTPQLVDKGRFTVQDREHDGTPDQLTITARSADLTRAFRTRRTQTWRDTTLGAVLGEVAGRNGLQARVWPDKASIAVQTLSQGRESDSAFLARLGRLHDAVATVKSQTLIFAPIGSGQTAGGDPIPGFEIRRTSGDRHRWKAAERDNYSGVIAEYQDRGAGQRRTVTVGSAQNAKRLGRVYASEAAARRAAESARRKQDRKGAAFSIALATGRPDLYPERKGRVSGFKPQIDSTEWLISEAQHQLDSAGGLRTNLQMELGGSPAAARN